MFIYNGDMTIDIQRPTTPHILGVNSLQTSPDQVRVLTDADLDEPNPFYEWIIPDKETHPFWDIDSHKVKENNKSYRDEYGEYKYIVPDTKEEFDKVVNSIEKLLQQGEYEDYCLINRSSWNYKNSINGNPKPAKISFSLRNKKYKLKNMKDTRTYCMGEVRTNILKHLGSYAKWIEIDASVYRTGDGGKMSCVYNYKKGEKTRYGELINGTIEDTFIQYMWGNEELITPKTAQKLFKNVKSNETKPKLIIKEQSISQNTKEDKPPLDEKLVTKFWKYMNIVDKNLFSERSGWIKLTYLHINILGIQDYENYDNYCKLCPNYDDALYNKLTYEGIEEKKPDQDIGWGTLYKWAYDSNPEEKYKLDHLFKLPFNIDNMIKYKNTEEGDKLLEEIEKIENDEDLKASAKKKKIKELNNKMKDMNNETYNKMKKYFEAYHFKLLNPFNYIKLVDDDSIIACYNRTKFRDYMENVVLNDNKKFIDRWLKDHKLKSYDAIDFIPYGKTCPKNTFNLFNGFEIEKVMTKEKKDFKYIKENIKLLANDNDEVYDYLIKYFSHLVQKPGILPETALVIMGKQGTGKSMFFEQFGKKILGERYTLQTSNTEAILGRFNLNKNKLLVVMEETEGKDTFLNSNDIKTKITQERLIFESKGKDMIKVRNSGRYIFISNNKTPAKIEVSDRRFLVTKCSNRHIKDRTFFGKVLEEWNDDVVVRSFYDYLQNVDLTNWCPVKNRVITEEYKDLQQVNIPKMAKWLENKCYELSSLPLKQHKDIDYHDIKRANELFDDYYQFMRSKKYITKHENGGVNWTNFGRDIKEYKGLTKRKSSSGVVYFINYDVVRKYLKDAGYINEECNEIEDVPYTDDEIESENDNF